MRKIKRTNFRIYASPWFRDVWCPRCGNDMIQLENGWSTVPVWWCGKCTKVYQLELRECEFDIDAVNKQLAKLDKKKNESN